MRNLVIIPTYNELDNIRPMIDKVFSLPEKSTAGYRRRFARRHGGGSSGSRQKAYPESLHLIERQGKLGLGTAYLTRIPLGAGATATTMSSRWTATSRTTRTT